jgi:hypothetical protein
MLLIKPFINTVLVSEFLAAVSQASFPGPSCLRVPFYVFLS